MIPSGYSQAEEISEPYTLKLTDSDGNDLSDPLFGGKVTFYFDTYDTPYGKIYKLKAMLSIRTMPANLVIHASGGLFKLSVSATGLKSFFDETGMRVSISDGADTYTADMRKSNGFSDDFRNGSNIATLEPDVQYSVSFSLIDGYESAVSPDSVSGITITFQAIAGDGFHQVMFISQNETVESYMAFDNYVIEEVPSVSRSGYTFNGWYTADGREVSDGFTIAQNDGDIIAFAEWEKDDSNNGIIYASIGGGVGLIGLLLLLVLLKRKSSEEPK